MSRSAAWCAHRNTHARSFFLSFVGLCERGSASPERNCLRRPHPPRPHHLRRVRPTSGPASTSTPRGRARRTPLHAPPGSGPAPHLDARRMPVRVPRLVGLRLATAFARTALLRTTSSTAAAASPPHRPPPPPPPPRPDDNATPLPPPNMQSRARVYADVNTHKPRSWWDYEALNVEWGCVFLFLLECGAGNGLCAPRIVRCAPPGRGRHAPAAPGWEEGVIGSTRGGLCSPPLSPSAPAAATNCGRPFQVRSRARRRPSAAARAIAVRGHGSVACVSGRG
jgi:hypothetical protein